MASKGKERSSQKGEIDLNWVYKYLKDGVYPPGLNFTEKRMVRKRAERFCLLENVLYYLGTPTDQELGKKSRKVLITYEERWNKVEECHISADGTHLGHEKTADNLTCDFHFVGIYKFIKEYIRQCPTCVQRNPKMLAPSGSTAVVAESVEVVTTEEVQSSQRDVNEPLVEEVTDLDLEAAIQPFVLSLITPAKAFWEKVAVRLFGPFKFGDDERKYILIGLDAYTLWPEAFVLDMVTPAVLAQDLLQLICRYGQMGELVMTNTDDQLEVTLNMALQLLQDSNIQIQLHKGQLNNTDASFVGIEELIKKFVTKHPKTWSQCIEFCLMPLRQSKNPGNTPSFLTQPRDSIPATSAMEVTGCSPTTVMSSPEHIQSDSLMSAQEAITSRVTRSTRKGEESTRKGEESTRKGEESNRNGEESTPIHRGTATVEQTSSKSVYVTRSRTGNAKPKAIDEDNFETSTPKRKTVTTSSPSDTPSRNKRVRLESITPRVESTTPAVSLQDNMTEYSSDTDSDMVHTDDTGNKKQVDLDTYYEAIKLYVTSSKYPDNTSHSFKRLIRDQAKHYQMKDGDLLHEVGNRGVYKKIIMSKEERLKLLSVAQERAANKSQMFTLLDNVHWKGKLTDCEAYLLASLHGDKLDHKSTRDSGRRHLAEAKKLLEYDTFDTYKEISNYIVYDVFSDDTMVKRLDHLKRQLKNFRVENGELIHMLGNKKCKVITSSTDRQTAIATACQKKGNSADLTSVFTLLSDTVYWFGMKIDVKIYLSYQDNKHLLDRYFSFREVRMKEPIPTDGEDEMVTEHEVDTSTDVINVILENTVDDTDTTTLTVDTNTENTPVSQPVEQPKVQTTQTTVSTPKPSGIFVSSVVGRKGPEKPSNPSTTISPPSTTTPVVRPTVVTIPKVTTNAPVVRTPMITKIPQQVVQPVAEAIVSESGDAVATGIDKVTYTHVVEEVVEEEAVTENYITYDASAPEPKAILVKLNEHGQAVVINEADVTAATTQGSRQHGNSDDITMAAVKSILQDSGGGGGDYQEMEVSTTEVVQHEIIDVHTVQGQQQQHQGQVHQGQVHQGQVESEGITHTTQGVDEKAQPHSAFESGIDEVSCQTTDNVDTVDDDDGENSDDLIYDTDEDEEEDYDEGTGLSMGYHETPEAGGADGPGEKRVVTPRQHFKCSQCDKIFYGPIKFKMHMYKHTGQKPFPCNLCPKKYTNKKSLVTHQRTHSGELPFLCSLCGKRCPSKIALKSHLKCHDGMGGGFPAKCDICDRIFSRKHLMERHRLHKHINVQTEFKCTECSKVFGHQRSLKRHFMSAHMGVKNHVCGLCGKSFFRKEYLTGHLIQHGGTAAQGLTLRKRYPWGAKPRPSVFNYIKTKQESEAEEPKEDKQAIDEQVQRIILHQDENGQLRVVDMATEREVKRMLESRVGQTDDGGTMVVHIEEPGGGAPQVVHVEQTEEQVVEVPLEEQTGYVEYQQMEGERPQEYVISTSSEQVVTSAGTQYIYTNSNGEIIQGNQELVYGQPAVQYEVECVGDVGDEEALSAINLLAQASAQQYETVISQISDC